LKEKKGEKVKKEEVIRDACCIGRNIRRIRLQQNIGQTDLVRMLQLENINIIREALVKIESGRQSIKLSQLRAIKKVLNTTYDELLEENE